MPTTPVPLCVVLNGILTRLTPKLSNDIEKKNKKYTKFAKKNWCRFTLYVCGLDKMK